MIIRKTRRQQAFTLMEAMVATVILALALVSVLGVAGRAARYLSDLRRSARASQVLQQQMEDIRLRNWGQMLVLTNEFTDPKDTNKIYRGQIFTNNVASTMYGTTQTAMRVTLLVTWTNQNGRVLSNQLSTIISQGGLNKYIF